MPIKNYMICELRMSSNNTSVGRMGKGGKAGHLFTDGLNNPDAFKLSPQSQALIQKGGACFSEDRVWVPLNRVLQLPSGHLGVLMAMNLDMVELPYWPGNASDYNEGPVFLLHTMESGGVCTVPRGFARTSHGRYFHTQ